jgi:hypothetical protein
MQHQEEQQRKMSMDRCSNADHLSRSGGGQEASRGAGFRENKAIGTDDENARASINTENVSNSMVLLVSVIFHIKESRWGAILHLYWFLVATSPDD